MALSEVRHDVNLHVSVVEANCVNVIPTGRHCILETVAVVIELASSLCERNRIAGPEVDSMAEISYGRQRFPPGGIQHANWLCVRFSLSSLKLNPSALDKVPANILFVLSMPTRTRSLAGHFVLMGD